MIDEWVGNAQRTEVLELLNRALEEGYLSIDEYKQRMRATSDARTMSDLRNQLSDLPDQFRWHQGARPAAVQPPQEAVADRKTCGRSR